MTTPGKPAPSFDSSPVDAATSYRTGALMSILQLHWFIRLRWGFIVVAGVAMAAERLARPSAPRPVELWGVLLVIALANAAWLVVSRMLMSKVDQGGAESGQAVRSALVFANAQVATDLLLLTAIIRYTGGIENPMAVFYLFHMAIGSLVLRLWQAVLQGVWAVVLYAGLGLSELWGWMAPHYAFLPGLPEPGLYDRPEYVATAIGVFAFGVFGTLFFTSRIAVRLDERERRLREAHEALQRSQTAIFDLQARRSRFMQTAAHQLKSPLAGIQTLTGLIRDGIATADKLRPTCDKIIRRCREGIAQVTELLTLARMHDADPRRQRGSVCDVVQVAQEVCRILLPQAQEKKIALHCEVAAGLDLQAQVHPTDLRDCVLNLVDNAIKYTPGPGSVTVTVGRGESTQANQELRGNALPMVPSVHVTVKDTGMGIEEAALPEGGTDNGAGSIFDAFRRGNGALAAGIPGTGLGLSIVREVVEQAGGRIRVRSRVGAGSEFTVLFPAYKSVAPGPAIRDTRSSRIVIEPLVDRAAAKPEGAPAGALSGAEESNHAG